MKVICDREKLRECLAIANSVIPKKKKKRVAKPVLRHVCLVATKGALELIGSDLEVSMRLRIEGVTVEEPRCSRGSEVADSTA
jgi:DNA polymerase III sliding clamp (beta) subunit (PCNA family)